MTGIALWERYFLAQTLRSFFSILFGFYALYVVIDYASHASNFNYHHAHFKLREVFVYYLCEFVERFDVLIPFALLIATIRTTSALNIHRELVAMLASGMRLQILMRPFIIIGLFLTAVLYLNTEVLLPLSLRSMKHIEDQHARQKNKSHQLPSVQHLVLDDKSTILFQSYDVTHQRFFDAYWIRSPHDIYRIRYLYPYDHIPRGEFVDHLIRSPAGHLAVDDSFPSLLFPEIKFNAQRLFETIILPEELSLSELWQNLPSLQSIQSEKESTLLANFYRKMAIPWLCLFAVLAPLPSCTRYTRNLPLFFIYAFGIFGLVAFYLLIDAVFLLGKRQVVSPLAIFIPFIATGGILLWRFFRMR